MRGVRGSFPETAAVFQVVVSCAFKDDGGALRTNERNVVGCQLVERTRQEGVGRRVELGLNINSSDFLNAEMTAHR